MCLNIKVLLFVGDYNTIFSAGFGDVPPIRPLETLHNALSLRKLDSFLQDMILAQIFKTPTGSPPRGFSKNTLPAVSSMTLTASNQTEVVEHEPISTTVTPTFDRRGSESGSTADAHLRLLSESQCPNLDDSNTELRESLAGKMERKCRKKSVVEWQCWTVSDLCFSHSYTLQKHSKFEILYCVIRFLFKIRRVYNLYKIKLLHCCYEHSKLSCSLSLRWIVVNKMSVLGTFLW